MKKLIAIIIAMTAIAAATAQTDSNTLANLPFSELKTKAEQGDADAQFQLALRYHTGNGIDKNPSEAVIWYQKAANQGNADAQNNLAACYASGDGVAKDTKQMLHWIKKAAEQGNPMTQSNLGYIYYNGTEGLVEDYNRAAYWYRKAAEQGNAEAGTAACRNTETGKRGNTTGNGNGS